MLTVLIHYMSTVTEVCTFRGGGGSDPMWHVSAFASASLLLNKSAPFLKHHWGGRTAISSEFRDEVFEDVVFDNNMFNLIL